MPVQRGEGPVGIIVCPSRELARQSFDIIEEYGKALREGEQEEAGRKSRAAGGGPLLCRRSPAPSRLAHPLSALPANPPPFNPHRQPQTAGPSCARCCASAAWT